MDEQLVVLHLSLISGIGPAAILRLLTYCAEQKQSLVTLYQMSESMFVQKLTVSPAQAHAIWVGLRNMQLLETELKLIEQNNVQWTTIQNAHYPYLLKQIYLPPVVLYWKGEHLCLEKPLLALIGSRRANRYALNVIKKLVPDLVAAGWTTVSGGAIGADSFVHEVTLEHFGRTIAVLGSGLLNWYPAKNNNLFNRILDNGGSLVSSFALQTEAHPGNFPARNRIISGLSYGCVVIQAALESGTQITAQYCLNQGRELFAVPGPIDDPLSAGCHALIQQGAKLVVSVQDIIKEFDHKQFSPMSCTHCEHVAPQMIQRSSMPEQVQLQEQSNPIAYALIEACRIPQSTDALVELTGCSAQALGSILFELQLEGKIVQDRLGLWRS